MGYVLGVDLGTTYSAAAIAEGDRCDIVQLGSRSATIPSLVFLRDDGEMLVGEAAERRAAMEPARAGREFKRRLGDPAPMLLGGTPFSAETLMARLLRSIVAQVTEERGEAPQLLAVTHPASYGDYKLDLMRQMVRQAEVGDAIFLPEPVAAALHYASQERIEAGAAIAVYDFGGGTFDAALLRKNASAFEILGQPEGIERLGGIDFDEAVFAHVAETLGRAVLEGDGSPAARAALSRLREECRDAKESLSADTEATIPVMLPAIQSEVRLTRGELEDVVRPRVRETAAALERSVKSAGMTLDDVDRVLLVGGSSRIPLVGMLLREMTGRPISRDSHPKHTIALGAALFARDSGRDETAVLPETAAAVPVPAAALKKATDAQLVAAARAVPLATERDSAPTPEADPPSTTPATAAPVAALSASPANVASAEAARRSEPAGPAAPASAKRWLLLGGAAVLAAGAVGVAALLFSGGDANAAEAEIADIWVANGAYQVAFEAQNFTPAENANRLHFYWDTVAEEDAGEPGAGPWMAYWGASPAAVPWSQQPASATKLCVAVANSDGEVQRGSGNCRDLPAR